MTFWLDEEEKEDAASGRPSFYQNEDPDGSIRVAYRRVMVDLGGPPLLFGERLIDDNNPNDRLAHDRHRILFKHMLHYPLATWDGWAFDAASDEEIKWWPWLADMLGTHVIEVRTRKAGIAGHAVIAEPLRC